MITEAIASLCCCACVQLVVVIRIGTEGATATGAAATGAAVPRLLLAVMGSLQYITIVVAILGESIVLFAVSACPAATFRVGDA